MGFDKNPVAPRSHGRPRQHRRQNSVSRGSIPTSSRTLNRVCRVENHPISKLPNPVKRPHIGHEIVVAKAYASFSKEKPVIPKRYELLRNILHIPRGEKLSLLDIYNPAS